MLGSVPTRDTGRPSTIVNTLLEQSRMHPAIGDLVSNTFYDRKLAPSDRVKRLTLTVTSTVAYLTSPIVQAMHANPHFSGITALVSGTLEAPSRITRGAVAVVSAA